MHELFDGCLHKHGIVEKIASVGRGRNNRALTDGLCGYLMVSADEEGYVDFFLGTESERNLRILRIIAFTFNVEIYSEKEPQFFVCDTDEEVDGMFNELARLS